MVMDKNLVVAKMVSIAEKNNIEAMKASGMQPTDMMMMADQVRPQLFRIQEEILDALIADNIIEIKE
jgi:hypothetical protein